MVSVSTNTRPDTMTILCIPFTAWHVVCKQLPSGQQCSNVLFILCNLDTVEWNGANGSRWEHAAWPQS